jgi:hypothetical protein
MSSGPIEPPADPQSEARSRLISLLSVCEHELVSLEALGDDALSRITERTRLFHDDLLDTLETLPNPPEEPG